MKKIAITFLVIFTAVLVLSSCKAHQQCPAYSKVNTQTENVSHS